jgi:PleD family two-component response regulator
MIVPVRSARHVEGAGREAAACPQLLVSVTPILLVVEDNARLRAALERGLVERQWEVTAVATGIAALDLLAKQRCDV